MEQKKDKWFCGALRSYSARTELTIYFSLTFNSLTVSYPLRNS